MWRPCCCPAPLCCHLIGYLDGEGKGVAELEAALEELLVEGTEPVYTAAAGDGAGVQLTISRPVQQAVEGVAAGTMTTGCILVLDVETAQVRAAVSVPGYDPADVSASPLLDRALAAYAVGSVFKPVLVAAAIEAGLDSLAAPGQLANFSFGQGELLAAPLQVAAMMNAIAADGTYRAPTLSWPSWTRPAARRWSGCPKRRPDRSFRPGRPGGCKPCWRG